MRTELRSLMNGPFPARLQSGLKVSSHGRTDVPVDAVHSRHLMAHPFGFQDPRAAPA